MFIAVKDNDSKTINLNVLISSSNSCTHVEYNMVVESDDMAFSYGGWFSCLVLVGVDDALVKGLNDACGRWFLWSQVSTEDCRVESMLPHRTYS